jgi:hypothetical protein
MMKLKDIMLFREMLGPKLITFNYWVLSLVTMGMYAFTLYTVSDSWYLMLTQVIMLLITMALIRLGCELVMAIFKIQANLKKIADNMPGKTSL